MTIWRFLPYILVVLLGLCVSTVAAEFTLTPEGTVPQSSAGNITFTAQQAGESGLSVMAVSSDPDGYSLMNTLIPDPSAFGLTTESSGGSEKQITSGKLNHVNPRISEKYVVYEEWNAGMSGIGIYDTTAGNTGSLYPTGKQQTNPDVSGSLVVYEQDGAYGNAINNVYAFDVQAQTSAQVSPATTNQNQPSVSGRYMVWQDWRSGNADIALTDLNSGTTTLICKDLGDQKNPSVSGGYVVWEDWRNGNADIYLYDIAAGTEHQLTTNRFDQKNPRISGKILVWEDNRNGGSDVYAASLENLKEIRVTSGSGKAVNPDVSGALVVWEDYRNNNADIMLLDLITGRIYQISTDQYDQKKPSIYGCNIVWEDYRSGNPNIFLFSVKNPVPSGSGYRFYGSATSCGSAAPAGSVITAVISGSGEVRGSITTTCDGAYGAQYGPYLEVPVNAGDAGKLITFFINDKPADQTIQIGNGGTQVLDLTASCSSPVNSYQFSGSVMLDSQYAPTGTIISALVDGRVRTQTPVSMAGQYSGLTVPIYAGDAGKYLTFTAVSGGLTYETAQQVYISSAGSNPGTGDVIMMSAEAAGEISAEATAAKRLDLTFTRSTGTLSRYLLNGAVMLSGQYAPQGTVITALIDNQARSQVSVYPAGQYSGLSIPVYPSDAGKAITFTAYAGGVTYTTSQQVWIGTAGSSGGVTLMSAESAGVAAEGTISQRIDLTFTGTSPSSSRYLFYGTATIDGSPMSAGRLIYATVDGQVRAQISVSGSGKYGSERGPYLEVPISSADIGRTIRFQTDSGAEADQTQLIVSGMTLSKALTFSSKPATSAEFTATPVTGTAPLTVKFTDKSTGSPKSYYWDFGDGTTSTDRNPSHIFTRDGVYSVGLVVTYWNGQTRTAVKQGYISVGAVSPPNAQIGLNPGWNFVSTPKMLTEGMNNAKAIFGKVDVGGHSIFSYNPKTKSWTTVTASTVINPLDAVWVYSTRKDSVNLYFEGDALQIPPTRKLVKGWNTFGVTSLNPVPAYNALLSIRDKWVYVIGYESATQRFQNTIMNVPDSAQNTLYPGYGYWIYMSEEGELAAIGL